MNMMHHEYRSASAIEAAIALACRNYGITKSQLVSRKRDAKLVKARREAAELARQGGATLHRIGEAMNRDHSTVINLVRPKYQFRVLQ